MVSTQEDIMSAIFDVIAERQRQIQLEGFDAHHDDTINKNGELSLAAGVYAIEASNGSAFPRYWPWEYRWWKPTTRRRDLVKAAALIIAEIERLDRISKK